MPSDHFDALAGKSGQIAVDVADMPDELGMLLDKGIQDHLNSR